MNAGQSCWMPQRDSSATPKGGGCCCPRARSCRRGMAYSIWPAMCGSGAGVGFTSRFTWPDRVRTATDRAKARQESGAGNTPDRSTGKMGFRCVVDAEWT